MKLLCIVLILISTDLIGQASSVDKSKKLAIGLSFSPDYNYLLPGRKSDKISSPYLKERNIRSISFGINSVYKFSERLAIELSLFYATKGKRDIFTYPFHSPGISNIESVSYYYNFLEIPIKLNTYILNKRLKIFPSFGFAANVILNKVILPPSRMNTSNYNKANISPLCISAVIGVGLSYDINKRLFVKLEPNYRQFITSIADGDTNGYLYSVGCNTGIYCRF